jgi:hypothetical protein
MPNQIKLNFSINNKKYWILIDCLDRPVINRWYNSIKQVYTDKSLMIIHKSNYIWPDNPKAVKALYNEILSAIETLKNLGVEWPVDELDNFDYTVEWCNRIHRYFTTMSLTGNRLDIKSKNRYTIDIENMEKYTKALHTINNNVHALEVYCSTTQKEKYFNKLKYLIVQPPKFKDKDYYKLYKFEKFEKEDFANHTWEHYDVVFDEEILGKHILRSFFDDDDPKNIDSAGFNGWFGSFRIYWDKCKEEIYNSNEFNNWLSKYKTNKENVRADFPIGNIIAYSRNINEMFINIKESPAHYNVTLEFIN